MAAMASDLDTADVPGGEVKVAALRGGRLDDQVVADERQMRIARARHPDIDPRDIEHEHAECRGEDAGEAGAKGGSN